MQRLVVPKAQDPYAFEFTTDLTEFRSPQVTTSSDTHTETNA
jgi:hypothetical protein